MKRYLGNMPDEWLPGKNQDDNGTAVKNGNKTTE